MKIKKAIKNIEDTYNCHSNDRACNNKERMKIEKEKNEIIELLQGIGDYPEIEKIFIDFDVRIHKMRDGEEIGKAYPLYAKYYDGYKECYNDIRDRIRELIRNGESMEEARGKREEQKAIEALKKIKHSEDGINERGKDEGRKKLIDKVVKDNGRK